MSERKTMKTKTLMTLDGIEVLVTLYLVVFGAFLVLGQYAAQVIGWLYVSVIIAFGMVFTLWTMYTVWFIKD